MRLVVVGGGIIGTAIALEAVERGHHVVQLERHVEPRGATVRNFGLIWILGRGNGRELDLALRGRELWRRLGERAPAIGFHELGAMVVAQHPRELQVLEAFERSGAAAARGARLLDAEETRRIEPALQGHLLGALYGTFDARVEPEAILPALRALAESSGTYQFIGAHAVRSATTGCVTETSGRRHACDLVLLCTGHDLDLLDDKLSAPGKLRVRHLQMLEAAPPSTAPRHAVLDAGALHYYPAFDLAERDRLPAQDPVALEFAAQLLVTPRASGGLTVGDTHVDDVRGAYRLDERAYDYLAQRFGALFGEPLPAIRQRWLGHYLRREGGDDILLRQPIADGVVAVTAVGGMGLTAGPAIAAETLDDLGL